MVILPDSILLVWGQDAGYQVAGLDYGADLYMPFFHLPSVETFEMSLGHFPKLENSGIKQSPSPLTTFRLSRTGGITPQHVADLLAMVPNIQTLHLGWNEGIPSHDPFGGLSPIDFAAITELLGPLSQTLKVLTIGVTHY
jgi:hypothetical protein